MFTHTKFYHKDYQSDLLRGRDEPRPWNLETEILHFTRSDSMMLDIGAGAAKKLINIAKRVKEIIALEPSREMRELAYETIRDNNIKNIRVVEGLANSLPFPDNSFDIVTCILAPWDSQEVFRVLKPGGYFINETTGCEDKIEFKKEFGKDAEGNWRGYLMQYEQSKFIQNYQENFNHKFLIISIRNGFWNTYYTPQGLIELCQQTPTIKNFNIKDDKLLFETAIAKLMTESGVKIQQNRLLGIVRKV